MPGTSFNDLREFGEKHPAEFFRQIVEPMADSFDPAQAQAYEQLMSAWIPDASWGCDFSRVSTVYVLSRVTLGADIKITSIILDAMSKRFPEAEIIFVGSKKSAELFRVPYLEANYPRKGTIQDRIAFAHSLPLNAPDSIVVDPDSRITQLGLIPLGQNYFHFPSRTANTASNLTDLTNNWLEETFHQSGVAFISPAPVAIEGDHPRVAISLGVGENETKRIPGDFESNLLRDLSVKYKTLWIDRGAGGEEAARVTAAAAGLNNVLFWEGSFAGFASIISQCDHYVGYDSAGQHAAAACGTPLTTYFVGAPSIRFRERWAPSGRGPIEVITK